MKNPKGSILTLTLAFMLVFTILGVSAIYLSGLRSDATGRQIAQNQAFWVAEAGLASATEKLRLDSANGLTVPDTLAPLSLSVSSVDGSGEYSWQAGDPEANDNDPSGLQYFSRNYTITSTGTKNEASVTLNQDLERQRIFIFQFAVFYEDDLELLPGQPMTLTGRIHSNHDIYIGSNGSTLTINSNYLHTVGNIYNKRKDGDSLDADGRVLINNQAMQLSGEAAPLDSERADWATESQNRWGGTVQSGVHGISRIELPILQSIQPGGYYDTKAREAGLKIENTTVYFNGAVVTLPASIIKNDSFFDARENKDITVTTIDLDKLSDSGYFPQNGLIYATRTDATPSQPNGIRLTNGSELPANLTVVSNDPVYVQGDYNKLNKKSAAIICDAINILSNNWKDNTQANNRVATDTEVNAGFIAGIKPTQDSQYSGGVENYLRFLENWTNKTLTVRGSFIELGASKIATGDWHYGMPYYVAPNRNWDYDSLFNNSDNMPPFTPFGIKISKGAWSQSSAE